MIHIPVSRRAFSECRVGGAANMGDRNVRSSDANVALLNQDDAS